MHVVEQEVDHVLGDLHLRLLAGRVSPANPDQVVEVAARVEVHVGFIDLPRPVPDRVQGVLCARGGLGVRVLHVRNGIFVEVVFILQGALVHLGRSAVGVRLGFLPRRVAMLHDGVGRVLRRVIGAPRDRFVHAARVVDQQHHVGLNVRAENVAVVGEHRRVDLQRQERGDQWKRGQSLHAFHGRPHWATGPYAATTLMVRCELLGPVPEPVTAKL